MRYPRARANSTVPAVSSVSSQVPSPSNGMLRPVWSGTAASSCIAASRTSVSSARSCEGVALIEVTGVDARPEPLLALRRRAVGERVGRDLPAGAPHQTIVADGRGRREPLLDVARLEHLLLAVRVMRPDAGVAIRLQLHEDLEPVDLGLVGQARLPLADPVHDAGQVLDVMPDLVADDVRLREVTGAAHPGQLLEEAR